MNKTGIAIIFRKPKFPVIISTDSVLSSAFGMQELFSTLIEAGKYTNQENIAIIDSTGDEFWYKPKNAVLMPGIFIKKWTKKRIIDLYNGTCMKPEMEYHRSYSNRLLRDVVKDICTLITRNTGTIPIMSVHANK